MKEYYQGIGLVLGTAVISGLSIFINKFGVKGIEPSLFAGLKNLAVGLVLVAIVFATKEYKQFKRVSRRQWGQQLLVGLLGGSLPFLLFFNGLSQTSGAKAGFIHKTMFIYVVLLSVWLLCEKISSKIIWGYLSLLAGLVLFLGIKPQALNWGDGLILAATLFWSAEIIISKKLLMDLPANIVAAARMFFGGIFIWLWLLLQGQALLVFSLSAGAWQWVGLTIVFLVAYVLTFYHGLKRIPAQEAAAVLSLGAPLTLLLTIIYKGSELTVNQGLGIFFIVASLIYLFSQLKPSVTYVLSEDNQ